MKKLFVFLWFVLMVGAAGAAEWKRLGRLPDDVSSPEIVLEYTDGSCKHKASTLPDSFQRFRDCDDCPEMTVVPAGSFLMGSPPSEKGRNDHEGPVHRVRIPEPFAAGIYEVTFEEWDACVRGRGCNGYRPGGRGWGRGRRPTITVGWKDAQAYVKWLRGKTGKEYRLLSEAEWEYAARGGSSTAYHWGDDTGRNRANCHGCGSLSKGRTAPVGSFPANGFGLHDVHGNVWEWVEDCWNDNYEGAPKDGRAWESGDCSRRVLRGGSWYAGQRDMRSANRFWFTAGFRNISNGFRVARTLTSCVPGKRGPEPRRPDRSTMNRNSS